MSDRIQLNGDGTLDEVVAGGAHLEQMADNHWWLSMRRKDGTEVIVNLSARGKIKAELEEQDDAPARPDTADLIRRMKDEAITLDRKADGEVLRFPNDAKTYRAVAALLREAVKALEASHDR